MLLADLWPTSSLLLTLRGLPPPQLPATLGAAAITLVPPPRLEDVPAALAQTDSVPKLWAPGRRGPGKRMLRMSQGSCYLPLGPPEGLAKVTRALFFYRPRWTESAFSLQISADVEGGKETEKDTGRYFCLKEGD